MRRVTIFQNILLMIFLSSIALLFVALSNLRTINSEIDSIHNINNDSLASVIALSEVRQSFAEARLAVVNHILNTDPNTIKNMDQQFTEKEQEVLSGLKSYEKILSNEEDRSMWMNDIQDVNSYFDFVKKEILPLSRENKNEEARDLANNQGTSLGKKSLDNLDTHVEFNKKLADKTVEKSLKDAEDGKNTAFIVIAVALSVIGIIGGKLASQIRARMNELRDYITNVNKTLNFTTRLNVTREDELGLTTQAFNQLLDRLQDNLKMIASNAQSVVSAADKLAHTSTQVATASHQQSEAASGMAAAIEEMTVSITHIGDRALEANNISRESGELAYQGEEVISQTANYIQDISQTVHKASNQIHELEDNSQQIANVIAVIKEVAEQTNLLALNAAIEAARAGEQGRGFAVVADEVRKLAERTSVSTQEIAHTIDAMRSSAANAVTSMQEVVSKVGQGVEKANEANTSIQKIGQGSRSAVGMVEEITTAIREQSVATNNISVQVERITQMSEESNSAAKESAKAAHDLDDLAMNMNKIVAAYTL